MDVREDRGSVAYVVLLSLVAALGGLLFGYDTAVVSGAVGFLRERFELDAWSKGFAASSALLGRILGAAAAGTMSDRFGRRSVLLLSAVLFTVSAIGSAVPRTLVEFNLARVLGGLGVGMASMLSPLYIAEVAPARIRGRAMSVATVCLWVSCYGVSLLFPYMLDTLAGKTFYLYAAMCVAALLFVAGFVPETKGRTLEEIERGWRRGCAGPALGVS